MNAKLGVSERSNPVYLSVQRHNVVYYGLLSVSSQARVLVHEEVETTHTVVFDVKRGIENKMHFR